MIRASICVSVFFFLVFPEEAFGLIKIHQEGRFGGIAESLLWLGAKNLRLVQLW